MGDQLTKPIFLGLPFESTCYERVVGGVAVLGHVFGDGSPSIQFAAQAGQFGSVGAETVIVFGDDSQLFEDFVAFGFEAVNLPSQAGLRFADGFGFVAKVCGVDGLIDAAAQNKGCGCPDGIFLHGGHNDGFGGGEGGGGRSEGADNGGGDGGGQSGGCGRYGGSGEDGTESGGRGGDAAIGQARAQFIQRPGHAFLGSVIADTQELADGAKILIAEVAHEQGITIGIAELVHGVVQKWANTLPIGGGIFGLVEMLHSFLFAQLASVFFASQIEGLKAGAAVEPSKEGEILAKFPTDRGCFAGEVGKDFLGDVLGKIGCVDLSHRRRVDEVGVTDHNLVERCLTAAFSVGPEQLIIRLLSHYIH